MSTFWSADSALLDVIVAMAIVALDDVDVDASAIWLDLCGQ